MRINNKLATCILLILLLIMLAALTPKQAANSKLESRIAVLEYQVS